MIDLEEENYKIDYEHKMKQSKLKDEIEYYKNFPVTKYKYDLNFHRIRNVN